MTKTNSHDILSARLTMDEINYMTDEAYGMFKNVLEMMSNAQLSRAAYEMLGFGVDENKRLSYNDFTRYREQDRDSLMGWCVGAWVAVYDRFPCREFHHQLMREKFILAEREDMLQMVADLWV